MLPFFNSRFVLYAAVVMMTHSLIASAACDYDEEEHEGVDCHYNSVQNGDAATFLYRETETKGEQVFQVVTEFHFDRAPGDEGYYKCGVWRMVQQQETFVRWIYPSQSTTTQSFPVLDTVAQGTSAGVRDLSYNVRCKKPFQDEYDLQFEVKAEVR